MTRDGEVYHEYCLNYSKAMTYLEQLRKNDEFVEFEKVKPFTSPFSVCVINSIIICCSQLQCVLGVLTNDSLVLLFVQNYARLIIIIIIIIIIIRYLYSAIMPLGGYRGAGGTGR